MMGIQDGNNIGWRYVFICGLHRSGTSLLGRNIARMENCTGFKDTGVIEDEGQFLQDVYPTGKVYGGAGKFGFDSRAHLTEASELITPENAVRLRQSWERHWDQSKAIRVEKTPGNLLKTRFLQAVFPNCYFVVVRRHPVPVSMANQRWKVSLAPLHNLFEHWLHCHMVFDEDRKHLKHVYELSYEDYVRDPDKYHEEIAAFIGTRVLENPLEQVTGAYNQKYFNRWSDLLNHSLFKRYYRYVAVKYEPRFTKYGYSLANGLDIDDEALLHNNRIASIIGPLYFLEADALAFSCRFGVRAKWYIKQGFKALLPEFVLNRIRQARQKSAPNRAGVSLTSLQKKAQLLSREMFVGGPVDDFEAVGRLQLTTLLREGLYPDSKVLDIGCGCLRGGYWLIHFLNPDCYYGIEPNKMMLDRGVSCLLEDGLVGAKRPRFDNNAEFDSSVFGVVFNFFVARSIWTHASKRQIQQMLDSFVRDTTPSASFLTSYLRTNWLRKDYRGSDWIGRSHEADVPGLVYHDFRWIQRECRQRGLSVGELKEGIYNGQIWLKITKRRHV
jgi:Sulfotransferase family